MVNPSSRTRIIACGVFRPALEHLEVPASREDLEIDFLPPRLHLKPRELERALQEEIDASKDRKESVVCLYGKCFPDIDAFCERNEVRRPSCLHCYEAFLGAERYRRIVEEITGTYFLEKELIEDFEKSCAEPLELHDEEIRKMFFDHYRRLIYIRQPSDPDLLPKAAEVARFLEMNLEVQDADYAHLKAQLDALLGKETR